MRFSVIIACHDNASVVAQAVDSVLAQQRDDVEVVVVDDGSSDDPGTALQGRAVTIVRQPNAGVAAARNTGIRHAQGAYIVPLDADDTLEPGYFDALAEALRADPSLQVLAVDTRIVGGHPNAGRLESDIKGYRGENITLAGFLDHRVPSLGHSVFERALLMRIGLYDAALRRAEDTDLVFRLFAAGAKVGPCLRAVYSYRTYGSATNSEKFYWNAQYLVHAIDKALHALGHDELVRGKLRQWREGCVQLLALHGARAALRARDRDQFYICTRQLQPDAVPDRSTRLWVHAAKLAPAGARAPMFVVLHALYQRRQRDTSRLPS